MVVPLLHTRMSVPLYMGCLHCTVAPLFLPSVLHFCSDSVLLLLGCVPPVSVYDWCLFFPLLPLNCLILWLERFSVSYSVSKIYDYILLSLKFFPYVCLKRGLKEIRLVALALFLMNKCLPFTKICSALPPRSQGTSCFLCCISCGRTLLWRSRADREFSSPFIKELLKPFLLNNKYSLLPFLLSPALRNRANLQLCTSAHEEKREVPLSVKLFGEGPKRLF